MLREIEERLYEHCLQAQIELKHCESCIAKSCVQYTKMINKDCKL